MKELWTNSKWLKLSSITASAFAIVLASHYTWYPHDNVVEELIEAKIKSDTTVDVDLTPNSLENQ